MRLSKMGITPAEVAVSTGIWYRKNGLAVAYNLCGTVGQPDRAWLWLTNPEQYAGLPFMKG